MKRSIKLFVFTVLILGLFFKYNYAQEGYQEKITPAGKVILGLSQDEALKKFGLPQSVSGQLWYYQAPEKFYVSLNEFSQVQLYPRFLSGMVGSPLELKVFVYSGQSKEVTSQAELFISQPNNFKIPKKYVLLPKRKGEYQVVARYGGIYSNTAFMSIKDSEGEDSSIEILPNNPLTDIGTKIDFVALHTIPGEKKGEFIVESITKKSKWFFEKNGRVHEMKDSKFRPDETGNFKVFCEYGEERSLPQEVKVVARQRLSRYLKNIIIIPPNSQLPENSKIYFRVFATYADNSVKEVTADAKWQSSNESVLKKDLSNIYSTRAIGVAKLLVTVDDKQSQAKVSVIPSGEYEEKEKEKKGKKYQEEKQDEDKQEQKKQEEEKQESPTLKEEEKKQPVENLLKDIKEEIKNLKEKAAKEDGFRYIKIMPSDCDIAAGEEKQFLAFGVRADNSQDDLTILGQWRSLDEKVAQVKGGLIQGLSTGETKICFQYKEMKAECIRTIVRQPRLVSIAVFPQKIKLIIQEKTNLKAEGFFGDSSRRNITSLVKWSSDNYSIARMEKEKARALKPGTARIYAEYAGIKSTPAELEALREKYWLLKLTGKIIFFFLLSLLGLYSYFSLRVSENKEKILKSYNQPREFLISLYGNLVELMAAFGQGQKFYLAPLAFAGLIEEKYLINEKLFINFTRRFEEAKYSGHDLSREISESALSDYNQILKAILAQDTRFRIALKYFKALLRKKPLFIEYAKGKA